MSKDIIAVLAFLSPMQLLHSLTITFQLSTTFQLFVSVVVDTKNIKDQLFKLKLFRERWAITCARAHTHLEMSRQAKNCQPNKQQITHQDCFNFFYKPNRKKENIN